MDCSKFPQAGLAIGLARDSFLPASSSGGLHSLHSQALAQAFGRYFLSAFFLALAKRAHSQMPPELSLAGSPSPNGAGFRASCSLPHNSAQLLHPLLQLLSSNPSDGNTLSQSLARWESYGLTDSGIGSAITPHNTPQSTHSN